MRRDAVDLRKEKDQTPTPPLSLITSVLLAAFLCTAGIALSIIGLNYGSGPEVGSEGPDPRPYIFLSSTIDSAVDRGNDTYEDLHVSDVLMLILEGAIQPNSNITAELHVRLSFLYDGVESIVLSASASGMPERSICGEAGAGGPRIHSAFVPVGDAYLSVIISLWGYDE